MSNLDELRDEINGLDEKILELLNRRAQVAEEVGRAKKENNLSVHDPVREREVISRLTDMNRGGLFPNGSLQAVFEEIMSACRNLQHNDAKSTPAVSSAARPASASGSVAFLGPKFTFSHQAAIQHFGESATPAPMSTIRDVFEAVERGDAECGIVPIENSIEGAIGQTLDMLTETGLTISGEVMLAVKLQLMNKSGRLDDIKTILSHPQPLGQARAWLDSHSQDMVSSMAPSTSAAAEISSKEGDKAAIANSLAAIEYDLKIIEIDGGIEDNPNNFTRFFVISKDRPAPTGNDKTSLLFSVKDEPGALFNILKPFSRSGINLTKIESRPSRKRAWEYLFFVDIVGHYAEPKVRAAVDELEKGCLFLKVLGSYPATDAGKAVQ